MGSGLFELVGVAIFECFFTSMLTPFIMDFTIATGCMTLLHSASSKPLTSFSVQLLA